jgi:hypothetical protein
MFILNTQHRCRQVTLRTVTVCEVARVWPALSYVVYNCVHVLQVVTYSAALCVCAAR